MEKEELILHPSVSPPPIGTAGLFLERMGVKIFNCVCLRLHRMCIFLYFLCACIAQAYP